MFFSSRRGSSHPNSPNGDDKVGQLNLNKGDGDFLDNPPNLMNPQMGGFQLDPSQFDQVGIDPVQFDYGSQLGGPPSMDSPNYNMDYQQQVQSYMSGIVIKPVLGVSDQVLHKQSCKVTEDD